MSIAVPRDMTREDFVLWEDRQELRYEFDGRQPIAMNGGTLAHSLIQQNLAAAFVPRLRGTNFLYIGNSVKILAAGSIRYPDGYIVCGPVSMQAKLIQNPMIIFEVLSPSTASTDRITKNHEYASTPSVQRYIMLEQDRIAATVFCRSGDQWVGQVLLGDAHMALPEIGMTLPLAELYVAIDFGSFDT